MWSSPKWTEMRFTERRKEEYGTNNNNYCNYLVEEGEESSVCFNFFLEGEGGCSSVPYYNYIDRERMQ